MTMYLKTKEHSRLEAAKVRQNIISMNQIEKNVNLLKLLALLAAPQKNKRRSNTSSYKFEKYS